MWMIEVYVTNTSGRGESWVEIGKTRNAATANEVRCKFLDMVQNGSGSLRPFRLTYFPDQQQSAT